MLEFILSEFSISQNTLRFLNVYQIVHLKHLNRSFLNLIHDYLIHNNKEYRFSHKKLINLPIYHKILQKDMNWNHLIDYSVNVALIKTEKGATLLFQSPFLREKTFYVLVKNSQNVRKLLKYPTFHRIDANFTIDNITKYFYHNGSTTIYFSKKLIDASMLSLQLSDSGKTDKALPKIFTILGIRSF